MSVLIPPTGGLIPTAGDQGDHTYAGVLIPPTGGLIPTLINTAIGAFICLNPTNGRAHSD